MKVCILNSRTKIVENIIVLESVEQFTPYKNDVELAPRHDGAIGWKWNGDGWDILEPEVSYDQKCEAMRVARNRALKRVVDKYTPIRWATLTSEQQQKILEYRQALLDIPQQEGFPYNINWPTVPQV
jgi:hypothetical protein